MFSLNGHGTELVRRLSRRSLAVALAEGTVAFDPALSTCEYGNSPTDHPVLENANLAELSSAPITVGSSPAPTACTWVRSRREPRTCQPRKIGVEHRAVRKRIVFVPPGCDPPRGSSRTPPSPSDAHRDARQG